MILKQEGGSVPNRAAKQRKMDRRKAHDAIKKRKRAVRKAKKLAREVAHG
tara:strand:+ start:305 stop:454 length:150 start_codon:yes stop_codon:yes gene_type:complete